MKGTSERKERHCSCGNFHDAQRVFHSDGNALEVDSAVDPSVPLESSFVHLPQLVIPEELQRRPADEQLSFTNFHAHYSTTADLLQSVLENREDALYCEECVFRLINAISTQTTCLENEVMMYQQKMREEQSRLETLKRALEIRSILPDSKSPIVDKSKHDPISTERTFLEELAVLEAGCQQYESELHHLKSLQRGHFAIAKQLSVAEHDLEVDRNAFQLEARAFNNDQEQLLYVLQKIQEEEDKLSSKISLPSLVLDIQVDKQRGLRYPLINELRLAYRPKGDIQWNEIQAAWSLAAQLLLFIGTMFQYRSETWKVVPLVHCAKLICYRKESEGGKKDKQSVAVYHLGHPKTKSSLGVMAWNELLCQVVFHVQQKQKDLAEGADIPIEFPPLPFAISSHTIGKINLKQLDENDDRGWSRVIHFMASDLLWLSECVSVYTSQQVLWTAAMVHE